MQLYSDFINILDKNSIFFSVSCSIHIVYLYVNVCEKLTLT